MYILGYDIDFGHTESAFLINSPKFSEKYTGYVATGQKNNNMKEFWFTKTRMIYTKRQQIQLKPI